MDKMLGPDSQNRLYSVLPGNFGKKGWSSVLDCFRPSAQARITLRGHLIWALVLSLRILRPRERTQWPRSHITTYWQDHYLSHRPADHATAPYWSPTAEPSSSGMLCSTNILKSNWGPPRRTQRYWAMPNSQLLQFIQPDFGALAVRAVQPSLLTQVTGFLSLPFIWKQLWLEQNLLTQPME